jgi:hypothetical protein
LAINKRLRRLALLAGAAGIVWIAWMARVEITRRLAFDNRGYPEHLLVRLWLDDASQGTVLGATCTRDGCETAPIVMTKGRHRIRLQVIVNNQPSTITETVVAR